MGVMAGLSLHSVIRTHERLNQTDKRMTQLEVAMTLLRRDFAGAIDKPVSNNGQAEDSSFIAGNNTVRLIVGGYPLQQVTYTFTNHNMVRTTSAGSKILLHDISSLQWQFIDDLGKKSFVWPETVDTTQPTKKISPMPAVVLMVIQFKNNAVIQGVFPVLSRGYYAQTP